MQVVALWRVASHRRHRLRSFSDWYSAGLAGVLVLVGLISLVALNPSAPSGCASPWCAAAVESWSVATVLGFMVVVHLAGVLVGPVSVNAAEAFWVFSSPIDRGSLILRRKVALLLGTILGGVVAGFGHSLVWSANPWWLIAFAAGGVAAMGLAMLREGKGSRITVATVVALSAGAVVSVAVGASSLLIDVTTSSTVVPAATALSATLAVLLTGRRAWNSPDTLPLPVLRRVQGTRDAVSGAVSSADSGLLLDVINARLLAGRSSVASFRLKGAGWVAVLEAETRRCLRSPRLLTRWLLVVASAALAGLFGPSGFLIGFSLATMVFASLNTSALRLFATSSGLARSFPQSAIVMRLLLVVPTALLVLGVALMVSVVAVLVPTPLLPFPSGLAVLAASTAGLAGGVRWATSPPTQFSAGIVMTEMGPVHVSALANALRGIDAAVLLSLPAVLGMPPVLWLVVPLAGLLWLLIRQ